MTGGTSRGTADAGGRDAPPAGFAVGCDVVDVARVAGMLARHDAAAERVFGARELADATRGGVAPDGPVVAARLAARFAAKEATRKVLGGRGPTVEDIEVHLDAAGAPRIVIGGRATALACSLSHDGGLAMAVVLAERSEVERILAGLSPRPATGSRAPGTRPS